MPRKEEYFMLHLLEAKEQVHLLADESAKSVFAVELSNKKYDLNILAHNQSIKCLSCHDGYLIKKVFNNNDVICECSNHPLCKYRTVT